LAGRGCGYCDPHRRDYRNASPGKRAPFFMYWILVHVTGIPPLEAQMLRSRGDRYRDYQSRTSAFFPLPPHA
jgi:steroid 5-alpha reductase family enzyme